MKQITVMGASRGLGLAVTGLALENRHPVVALAQNTDAIPEHPNLKKVAGDARDPEAVKKAIEGSDSIIFVLGPGQNMEPTTTFSESMKTMLDVIRQSGKKPWISCIIGFGGGESYDMMDPFFKAYFDNVLAPVYKDKDRVEKLLETYEGSWVMAYPGQLTDGPLTGFYIMEELKKGIAPGAISRQDMAHFLLVQAENNVLANKKMIVKSPEQK